MWLIKSVFLFGVSFSVAFAAVSFADAQEIGFVSNPVWLSTEKTTEGETVTASTVITKTGSYAMSGTVEFFANDVSIGTADFSLPKDVGGTVASVTFVPVPGTLTVSVKITRAVIARGETSEEIAVTAEAKAAKTLTVEPDNDRDKIPDATDTDDDNDGVSDADEKTQGTDPKAKEVVPSVAGTSTSSIDGATESAKDIMATMFSQTETLRRSMANYFDRKTDEAAKERAAKQALASDLPDIEEKVLNPKPLTEQIQDTSGFFEGFKVQFYSIGSFFAHNVLVFYGVAVLVMLMVLRKLWRRHSLD